MEKTEKDEIIKNLSDKDRVFYTIFDDFVKELKKLNMGLRLR